MAKEKYKLKNRRIREPFIHNDYVHYITKKLCRSTIGQLHTHQHPETKKPSDGKASRTDAQ